MVKILIWLLLIGAAVYFGRKYLMGSSAMSVDEARRILGVAADADADAINTAHRNLIAKVHPDKGGSAELAARVNRARDVLLHRISN